MSEQVQSKSQLLYAAGVAILGKDQQIKDLRDRIAELEAELNRRPPPPATAELWVVLETFCPDNSTCVFYLDRELVKRFLAEWTEQHEHSQDGA